MPPDEEARDVEIDITPGAPSAPNGAAEGESANASEGAPSSASTPEPIDELRTQFEELKARSRDIEQRERDALQRAADAERNRASDRERAQVEAFERELATCTAGIATSEAEAASAESDWAAAMAANDFAAAARAQRRMQRAENTLARLEDARGQIERMRSAPREPDPPSDPIERFCAGRTARTASWIRAHPDYVLDPEKNAAMIGAHHNAIKAGRVADTEEYFAHVEARLGLRDASSASASRTSASRSAPAVAPGSGSQMAAPVSASPQRVVLSRAEAEAAEDGTHRWAYDDPSGKNRFRKGDPIGRQEFARRKAAMTKAGYYDKQYTE